MFVPLALLAQQESILYTPEDAILVLDRYILPHYPTFTTTNPGMTKQQCMGVLNSFHNAGKFHLSLKPVEIEQAVDAFLEDRLWVPKSTLETLTLLPNYRPDSWMAKPTFFRVFFSAIPRLVFESLTVLYSLLAAATKYTFYSLKAAREVKVPKNPNERKPATPLSLIKKDS